MTTAELVEVINATHAHAKQLGLKRGNGGTSKLPCPICKSGTISYSVANVNGHIWATCSTKDCARWIE